MTARIWAWLACRIAERRAPSAEQRLRAESMSRHPAGKQIGRTP